MVTITDKVTITETVTITYMPLRAKKKIVCRRKRVTDTTEGSYIFKKCTLSKALKQNYCRLEYRLRGSLASQAVPRSCKFT